MHRFFWVGCFAILSLTGCQSVKEKIGMTRHVPDEFEVMQRAPLEIPADLKTLPIPQPGAPRPQETTAKAMAQTAVLGGVQEKADTVSKSEKALLAKAGAEQSSSSIRQIVAKEAAQDAGVDKRPVIQRLTGAKRDAADPAHVVDAPAEAKRIIEAKKAGKPVTYGKIPTLDD